MPAVSSPGCRCSLMEETRMPETGWRHESVTVNEDGSAAVRSTDLVDREYGELKLKERLGHVRSLTRS